MTRILAALLVTALATGSAGLPAAQFADASAPDAAREAAAADRAWPTAYAQDDPGEPGLALPRAIARGLETDERVLSCPEGTRDGVSQFAPDWVGVRRLDLDGDDRPDWIVNGRHACLRQPDATYWWVYQDAAAGPRVVLRAEPAAGLEILPTRTHGFRDLRVHRVGSDGESVTDVRYDGQTYVPAPAAAAPPGPPKD